MPLSHDTLAACCVYIHLCLLCSGQGLCETRTLEDFDGAKFHIALVSRRSRLHVGPRYKARGLNSYAAPGNEIECEQIIWRHVHKRDEAVPWSRYTWRRGSVPLWWSVEMKNNGLGEAVIKIKEQHTFKGSRRWVHLHAHCLQMFHDVAAYDATHLHMIVSLRHGMCLCMPTRAQQVSVQHTNIISFTLKTIAGVCWDVSRTVPAPLTP